MTFLLVRDTSGQASNVKELNSVDVAWFASQTITRQDIHHKHYPILCQVAVTVSMGLFVVTVM